RNHPDWLAEAVHCPVAPPQKKNHHTTSRPATPRYAVPMPNQPTPDPAPQPPTQPESASAPEPADPQPPTLIDHPTDSSFWRHSPPLWRPCGVCGHPTCWVEL